MTAAVPAESVIYVVDDDADFQRAIARVLRAAGYEVRCFSSAGDFFVSAHDERPGCLLLDVHLPGPSGLDMQDAFARMAWQRPIVFMSGFGDVPTTVRAIKAGAVDFLVKPVPRETLLAAVASALARDREDRGRREELGVLLARFESLTAREVEVLERVVSGMLNKVIASELGSAERTVKAHRARVMEKMGVASLAQLVHVMEQLRAAGTVSAPTATNA